MTFRPLFPPRGSKPADDMEDRNTQDRATNHDPDTRTRERPVDEQRSADIPAAAVRREADVEADEADDDDDDDNDDDDEREPAGDRAAAAAAENESDNDNDNDNNEKCRGSGEPPLPAGPPPGDPEDAADDGWQPIWDETYGAYYFYNSISGETTWTNPRVTPSSGEGPAAGGSSGEHQVDAAAAGAAAAVAGASGELHDPLQYNPAIHGDYDPAAPYAQPRDASTGGGGGGGGDYSSVAAFNRFTGKFQPSASRQVPENYNDENKSRRQMEFYFDVDAAANSHDGRSLKAERQTKRLSKQELKQYKEKRKQRKEEKRKAWLKD